MARGNDHLSVSIDIARVLCICSVIMVHAWPGSAHAAAEPGIWNTVHLFLRDVVGRSSVPLLGCISGWLVARSYNGQWRRLILSRRASLLLPLIAWNGIMLLLIVPASFLHIDDDASRFRTTWDIVNAFYAITMAGANIPVTFLRDLFVTVALAPVLIAVVRYDRIAAIALMAALTAATAANIQTPIVLRPVITLFFTIGLTLGIYRVDIARAASLRAGVVAALGVLALFGTSLPSSGPHLGSLVTVAPTANRFLVAYVFWCASVALGRTALGPIVVRLQPYIFFVFCSHPVTIKLFAPVLKIVARHLGSPLHPAIFLSQPVLCVVVAVIVVRILATRSPTLLAMLNAGRIVGPPRALSHPRPEPAGNTLSHGCGDRS